MELWDLYDQNRIKTGEVAVRDGDPIPLGRYHVVVHAAVFNSRGEMLIQRRQPWKAIFPGLWDITCGGSAQAGEDSPTAVWREVMEEVGLRVKNIRYYKSQPWGMAQDILMGFYCEVDGPDEIHRDDSELKYAGWVTPDELVLQPADYSLTNEMMKLFRDGAVPGVPGSAGE